MTWPLANIADAVRAIEALGEDRPAAWLDVIRRDGAEYLRLRFSGHPSLELQLCSGAWQLWFGGTCIAWFIKASSALEHARERGWLPLRSQ